MAFENKSHLEWNAENSNDNIWKCEVRNEEVCDILHAFGGCDNKNDLNRKWLFSPLSKLILEFGFTPVCFLWLQQSISCHRMKKVVVRSLEKRWCSLLKLKTWDIEIDVIFTQQVKQKLKSTKKTLKITYFHNNNFNYTFHCMWIFKLLGLCFRNSLFSFLVRLSQASLSFKD